MTQSSSHGPSERSSGWREPIVMSLWPERGLVPKHDVDWAHMRHTAFV